MSVHIISPTVQQKFQLGTIVATTNAMTQIIQTGTPPAEVIGNLLARHMVGDWGVVCKEDKQTNDDALAGGGRLMSVYKVDGIDDNVWVITEWDRSVTTVLMPEDY